MNGSAKRLMAVFAVAVMVVSAAVVIFTDAQDSSADTDYKKYYRDQLTTDFERNAYDKIANATNFGPFEVILAGSPSDADTVREGLAKAITAAAGDAGGAVLRRGGGVGVGDAFL